MKSRALAILLALALAPAAPGSAQEVGEDPAANLARYEAACRGGLAVGCQLAGTAYEQGDGVEPDPARAAELFERGCEGGDGYACAQLARLLLEGAGVPADPSRAAGLLERACEASDGYACSLLGKLHRDGEGVERDGDRARALFEAACDAGTSRGCDEMARGYAAGTFVEQDLVRAAAYLERACDLDDPFSCGRLASAYEEGRGVARDAARAAELLQRACDGGSPSACRRLRPFEELRLVAIGAPEGEPARVAYLLGDGEELITLRAGQQLVSASVLEVRDDTVVFRPRGDETGAREKRLFEDRAPRVAPASEEWTGTPISVDFDGDLRILVEVIADISGVNVVFEPGAGGRVRASAREAPWDGVLAGAVRDAGLAYQIDDLPGLRIGAIGQREHVSLPGPHEARGEPVSLQFRELGMVEIAGLFEMLAGRPVLLPEGPHEPLTITVHDVSWERVLAWIAASRGWELRIEETRVIAEAPPPPP